MTREMLNLDVSAGQLSKANHFNSLPIVSIKAKSFFQSSWWTIFIPLQAANHLRDRMHDELLELSTDCIQLQADRSSHFVWTDRPELILAAVRIILDRVG